MEKRPDAILLKFPGTNCDVETARCLETVGFRVETIPFRRIRTDRIMEANLVVLPGGFSYGDYIMAGRLAQLKLEQSLGDTLNQFQQAGGYVLGICNGFQILVRMGLLPAGSLIAHADGRFACRWVTLRNHRPDHPFLRALPEVFELPIACGEGRFVAEPGLAEKYREQGLATVTYEENFNGSFAAIAGLQNESGHVFGLMPHPERFLHRALHYDPDWNPDSEWGWGYYFFRSMYEELSGSRERSSDQPLTEPIRP